MNTCTVCPPQQNFPVSPLAKPDWRRVSELTDLTQIYDPEVQVCTWQREIDPVIGKYLSQLQQTGELQSIESMMTATPPTLDRLPAGPGREALIDDLSFLGEIICELLGCSEVGLRLARIGHAMCPGWHVDRVGIRLVCTYQGSGTQWLDDQSVDRNNLQSLLSEKEYIQATPGEIVLLKGALWQGNDAFGAIHRSPELESKSLRTLFTLDPLWNE